MRRREVITLLGGAAAMALACLRTARAQQSSVRRIGILLHGEQTDPLWQQRLAAFRQELERFGWLENRNIHIEVRYSGNDYDRLAGLAHEIVSLNPDVIFTNTTPAIKALQQETRAISLYLSKYPIPPVPA